MNTYIKRNINIELLRIISMLLIVIYHYQAREFGLYVIGNDQLGEPQLLPELILHSLGKLGVPIFVFISGYYGIKFKGKRLLELIIMTFFYALLSVLVYDIIYGAFNIKNLLIFTNHWWFITAYICLYLLSDGINYVLEKISKWQLLTIVAIFYFISFGDLIVNSANIGGLYIMFTMYLSARWIKLYFTETMQKYCWMLFPVLLFCRISIIFCGYHFHHLGVLPYINSYVNPLSMITAASLFYCFLKIKECHYKKIIQWFSSSALAVYLFSEGPCGQKLFAPLFPEKNNWNLILFLFGSMITYVIIACIDKIRIMIINKLITKN